MTKKNPWASGNIPDMSGKIALITGANSGIGYEAARALAVKGAMVIMACRSQQKGDSAAQNIENEGPLGEVAVMQLDLADLASVRQFAHDFRSNYDKLDILVNNAGVMAIPCKKTADGFEMQFGTNHLGHFALTGLLLDMLLQTKNSRVVTVSSTAHTMGQVDFDNLNSEKSYSRWGAYGLSKLANLLFAYELQRKLSAAGSSTLSTAAHPGYSATNLQRSSLAFRLLNPIIAQSQEMGALPMLYAATGPNIIGGDYIGPDRWGSWRGYPTKTQSNRASHDKAVAKQLWEVSESLTGVSYSF